MPGLNEPARSALDIDDIDRIVPAIAVEAAEPFVFDERLFRSRRFH
jgi:hypothetical protein